MAENTDLREMAARIKAMGRAAEELKAMASDFPAVYRNTSRILAGIKMLELNLSDLADENLLP